MTRRSAVIGSSGRVDKSALDGLGRDGLHDADEACHALRRVNACPRVRHVIFQDLQQPPRYVLHTGPVIKMGALTVTVKEPLPP